MVRGKKEARLQRRLAGISAMTYFWVMPPYRYVFNHFPKTAGSSFLALCRHNLAESEISPPLVENQLREARVERFQRYRLIRGHFGIASQMRVAPDRYSMTLLRDPIRRTASLYSYWRTLSDQNAAVAKARESSFAEFVRYYAESPVVVCNPYTHHFAALRINILGTLADDDTLLAFARQNLAAFDFVGICEEFEASAQLLCRELDWRMPAEVPRENVSGSERTFEQIDRETMDLLVERNRLDLELYEYGRALFHQRCDEAGRAAQRPGRSALGRCAQTEPGRFVLFPLKPVTERIAAVHQVSAGWQGGAALQTLEIAIKFRTRERIDDLAIGVTIHSADGEWVYSTNTAVERRGVENAPDRDCYALFTLDCGLAPGSYVLTVGLTQLRRLGIHCDRIEGAATFEVPSDHQSTADRTVSLRRFESGVGPAFVPRAFATCA